MSAQDGGDGPQGGGLRPGNTASVVVSGHGTLQAGALAVGDGARASKVTTGANRAIDADEHDEIRNRLDALLKAVDDHRASLDDPALLAELTKRVALQLSSDKPDATRLKSFLGTIASEARSVGEVVAAAVSLKELIGSLF